VICGLTNMRVNRVIDALREEQVRLFRSSLIEILDFSRLASATVQSEVSLCRRQRGGRARSTGL